MIKKIKTYNSNFINDIIIIINKRILIKFNLNFYIYLKYKY
jgi:hypothetical protein